MANLAIQSESPEAKALTLYEATVAIEDLQIDIDELSAMLRIMSSSTDLEGHAILAVSGAANFAHTIGQKASISAAKFLKEWREQSGRDAFQAAPV
jgi:hypothetical protein